MTTETHFPEPFRSDLIATNNRAVEHFESAEREPDVSMAIAAKRLAHSAFYTNESMASENLLAAKRLVVILDERANA